VQELAHAVFVFDDKHVVRGFSEQALFLGPHSTSLAWNTTATLQLFPVSRRMRVAFDSACRAQFEEIVL
jgi:hypothetical protein